MRRILIAVGITLAAALLLVQLTSSGFGYTASGLSLVPQVPGGSSTPIPSEKPAGNGPPPVRSGDYSDTPKGASAIIGPVTEASIRDNLQQHAQAAFSEAQNVTVTSIQFVTIGDLEKLIPNESRFFQANYPANKQVAYVSVTGDFYGDGEVPLMHHGYCVFDATTGNILMSAALVDGASK